MGYFVTFFLILMVFTVHSYKYKIEFDMFEALTSRCEKFPDRGVNAILNLSNYSMEKKNDDVLIDGSATFIWNEGGQFKRVEFRSVAERYQRGSWGPTTFNIAIPDLCTAMFDETKPWYTAFFGHVKEEFRNCSYRNGYKMEFEHFTLAPMEITVPGIDVTGIYRGLIYLIPYDENNRKMVDSIYCFIVPLEFVRIS